MHNITIFSGIRFWLAVLLALIVTTVGWGEEAHPEVTIPPLKDLSSDLKLSGDTGRPVMLIFSAKHCFYCGRLKKNIVKPMLISGDYDHRVIIRLLEIDDDAAVIGQDGKSLSPAALASRYKVRVTPTVLLLGPQGREIGERQLGINNEDYYGAYLDKEIEEGVRKIAAAEKRSQAE